METTEIEKTPPEGNNRNKSIIIALAVLLLGSLGFNIYQLNKNKRNVEEIEVLNIDLQDTENAKIVLQEKLDELTIEFEQTREDLFERDSILVQRDVEIFEKQKEIQNILNKSEVTTSELKKAQRMINSLNNDIAQFKREIAELRQQKDSLIAVTDTLNIKQTELITELETERQRADETEHKLRSTFSVSNYKIQGLKVRRSGKEVETDRARRIDKLRVSFDLDPNHHAESGQKEIFIAIYKPDGSLGIFEGANHGSIETVSLGSIEYSDKVTFNYQRGSKQNITFDWEDYDFPQGNYKIDLYQNGLKIGQETVELK